MKLLNKLETWVANRLLPKITSGLKENTEFGAFDIGIDSDEDQFRSLTGTRRDFPSHLYERSVRISQGLYETDPLYKRIINFPMEAITSAGFTIQSDNPKVKERLDEFWGDKLTGFKKLFLGKDGLLKEELLSGELNLPYGIRENGDVEIGFIDPLNIKNVFKVKGNALIDDTVMLKDMFGRDGKTFTVVRAVAGQLFGDLFRFTMNRPVNAKRGKPIHIALMDYIDLNNQNMFNELERWKGLKAFLWNLKTNMTQADAEKLEKQIIKDGGIKAGGIRVTDSESEWVAVTPDLKAADGSTMANLMLGFIGGLSVGGKSVLGFGEDINVATMRELMKIVTWTIEAIQREAVEILNEIFALQLQVDAQLGRMTTEGNLTVSDDLSFTVKPNRVVKRDFVIEGAGFQSVTNSISIAKTSNFIGDKTASQMFVAAANEFDFELVEQDVEDELAEQAKNEPAPDKFGNPNVSEVEPFSITELVKQ